MNQQPGWSARGIRVLTPTNLTAPEFIQSGHTYWAAWYAERIPVAIGVISRMSGLANRPATPLREVIRDTGRRCCTVRFSEPETSPRTAIDGRSPSALPYVRNILTNEVHAMSSARLTSKGQITVPRDVREKLRLKLGDSLRFRVTDSGQIVVESARHHVNELCGMLHRKGMKPVPVEAMDDALRKRFKKR